MSGSGSPSRVTVTGVGGESASAIAIASDRNDSVFGNEQTSRSVSGNSNNNDGTLHTKTPARVAVEDDAGVIAAPPTMNVSLNSSMEESGIPEAPAEIPPEPSSGEGQGEEEERDDDDDDNDNTNVDADEGEEDDESEYEYEDEDDAAFSGFLVDHGPLVTSRSADVSLSAEGQQQQQQGGDSTPARIRDEEESDTAAAESRKTKWREPSRAAISMSLRAEKEKTGSKRRLAQDLYRIMNQDTEEAGFSIAPKSEDNMDHWIIKLFKFDEDSNLAKDLAVLGFDHVELEMAFPEQYPFEPPFVRVVRPRFKRQTGFVMNGALCMELLTKDGWNPVNDIESVIVSVRSLLVVGDGRLQAAVDMSEVKYQARLKAAKKTAAAAADDTQADPSPKRQRQDGEAKPKGDKRTGERKKLSQDDAGSYSVAEAHAAYSHLTDYHKKKGWDSSGWWARKG